MHCAKQSVSLIYGPNKIYISNFHVIMLLNISPVLLMDVDDGNKAKSSSVLFAVGRWQDRKKELVEDGARDDGQTERRLAAVSVFAVCC